MARLTEIEDGSDSDTPRSASSSKRNKGTKSAGLTQAEQEQILHKSGLIEKLGLPKDFVTMDQAQSELDALNRSKKRPSGKPNKEFRKGADTVEDEEDDSEDDYGVDSDHELDGDDTANRLMQEQEATEMSPKVESFLDLVIWTMPFGFMYTLLDVLVRQQYGETIGFKDEALRLARALPGKCAGTVALSSNKPLGGRLTQERFFLLYHYPLTTVLALFIHYSKYALLSKLSHRTWPQLTCVFLTLIVRLADLTSKRQALIQGLLFVICSACGCSLIYIVNKVSLIRPFFVSVRCSDQPSRNALTAQSSYDVVVQRVAPLGTLWIFSVVRLDLLPACISLATTAMFVKQSGLKIVFD